MSHLFDKSVVGTIQVDFSQIVPIGKDQVGLLLCTDTKKNIRFRIELATGNH